MGLLEIVIRGRYHSVETAATNVGHSSRAPLGMCWGKHQVGGGEECCWREWSMWISPWALALSCSLPHAGDLFNLVSSHPLCLPVHDQEFRCCLHYWLRILLHNNPSPCPACHKLADSKLVVAQTGIKSLLNAQLFLMPCWYPFTSLSFFTKKLRQIY